MKHKILIMLDYPRLEYVNETTKEFDYSLSTEGKRFKKVLHHDLGLRENIDYSFCFLYNKIPEPSKTTRWGKVLSYKSPLAKELKPYKERMLDYINKVKPSLIIPQGTLSTKFLINKSITKCQGAVDNFRVNNNSYYVLPLYRQGYIDAQPNLISQRDIGLSLLKEYIEKGAKVFKSTKVDKYYEPHTVEEFKRLIARCKSTGELAWDTEDNTFNPSRKGAKLIIFSFSWAEGEGASLPLEHWEVYQPSGKTILGKTNMWTREQLDELYDCINTVMQAKTVGDIPYSSGTPLKELPPETPLKKVGHNIIFDLKFLMATNHITWANNILDTKIGYWLEISQSDKTNKRLSDLAFGLTTMGGYDAPLEEFKKFVKQQVFISAGKVLAEKAKKAKLKVSDTTIMLDETDHNSIRELIDWSIAEKYGFDYNGLEHWVIDILAIPKINKYRQARKIVNSIDPLGKGHDYNYEWNPLEVMSYYASGDADCCLRIHHVLLRMMQNDKKDPKHKLLYLYEDYYPKVTVGFACLEAWGMRADTDYIDKIAVKYTDEKDRLIKEMQSYPLVQAVEQDKQKLYEAGLLEWEKKPADRNKDIAKLRNKYKGNIAFNPKSSDDIASLLFDKMGYTLPYSKDYIKAKVWESNKPEEQITPDDYSGGKKTITYLLRKSKEDKDGNYDLLSLIQQYSKVAQLQSGFTTKLRLLVSNKDGNVHGSYNITGTACVSGDTLVPTADGIYRIEDLSLNREPNTFSQSCVDVYDVEGKIRHTKFYYTGVKDALELKLANGLTLTTTYNHLLRKESQTGIFQWATADSLQVGDSLAISVAKRPTQAETYVKLMQDTNTFKLDNLPKELTPNVAELIGMLQACPSILHYYKGQLHVNLLQSLYLKSGYSSKLDKLVAKVFKAKLYVHYVPRGKFRNNPRTRLGKCDIAFNNWFDKYFGIQAPRLANFIPDIIMQASPNIQLAYLKGFSTDTEGTYYTKSHTIAKQVQVMLNSLGMNSTIIEYNTLTESAYHIAVDTKKGLLSSKIVSIKPVGKQEMFDVNVAETHTFIANGIVSHNTSRSSSSNPNLQQLPAHTNNVDRYDYKYPIKREFVSRFKGGKLFNIDYSNLEFRILGLKTKEDSMTEAFITGHDIHKANASLAFNVPYEKVTKSQRQAAKSIGFGIVYGRGAQSVADDTGESLEQAKQMIDKFYASKPNVKRFIENTHKQVREQGYVNTIIGFRRDLQDIWSTDKARQSSAERDSVNTIIQGSGASLTNYAVYLITKLIHDKNLKSRVFVTVHDSIGLDCPPEEIPVVPELCLYIMTHLPFKWLYADYKGKHIRYPIDADMDIGNNYNDMVSYDREEFKTFKSADNYIKYHRILDYLSDLKESNKLDNDKYEKLVNYYEKNKFKYQS
jgi:DNA polymerase I-like protein with 3'-5' exonuclease and polymerase domains